MTKLPVVLDTETTGLDSAIHRVVEVAIIDYADGSKLMHTLINPEVHIMEDLCHSIRDADVKDAPKFRDIAVDLLRVIENQASVVIGYNPFFDQTMLDAEFRRLGMSIKWPILIDAKQIWDTYEPREKRDLQNAFKRFVSIDGYEGRHGAVADTQATRDVVRKQLAEFKLLGTPWEDLDPERKSWWGPSRHVLMIEGQLVLNFGKHKGINVWNVDFGFWRWLETKDFPQHMIMLSIKIREFRTRDISVEHFLTWASEYVRSI